MAYSRFINGFDISSNAAVDKRLLLSKAEMLTAEDVFELPSAYFCICSDDGNLYLYKSTNTPNEITGKYKLITSDILSQLDELSTNKQDKLTKGYGILIDNNNKISIDDVDISTVEYVDASITDTMNFIIQERDNEKAGREAGDELLQEAINTKQDIIEDLSTIKSGATLGATAVQPEAIVNMATIDMIPTDLSDFIEPPTSDGNYSLECTVSNGIATYSWALKS